MNKKYLVSFCGSLVFLLLMLCSSVVSAEPVVLYTDIISGPNSGGEDNKGTYLSIFGRGFGVSQGNSKVFINGVEVASYKYWGISQYGLTNIQQITIQPGPAISSGAIEVEVDGQRSNSNHSFSVSPGDVYFVSLEGDDDTGAPGDITKPYRNTWYAMHVEKGPAPEEKVFSAGDTIVIRGGTYRGVQGGKHGSYDYFNFFNKGGTSGKPLMVLGYPGEHVEITHRVRTLVDRPGWVTLAGLNINLEETSNHGFLINATSNNVRLVNNKIENIDAVGGGSAGIEAKAPYIKILGVTLRNVGSHSSIWEDAKKHHAIYFNDEAKDAEVGWSYIDDVAGGRGIQIYHGKAFASFRNMIIHDNVVKNTYLDAIILSEETSTNNKVYNNLIVNPGDGGIRINSYEPDCEVDIYNNTIISIQGRALRLNLYVGSQLRIRNNIIHATSPATYLEQNQENPIASHNLWYGNGPAPAWDVASLNVDPKFIDPGNARYMLQSESPAVDAGINTISPGTLLDFGAYDRILDGNNDGSALIDIGAYEKDGSRDDTAPKSPDDLRIN